MIKAIGIDIVDVDRIKSVIDKRGNIFLNKIFTENEINYCKSKTSSFLHYGARFAAKEAVAKAMRTGWSGVFSWKEIEVQNEPSGAPNIVLYGKVAKALENFQIHLSLSHSDKSIVAFVVLENK